MNGKNISENLRTFRKLLDLKQDDFAKPLGITGGYISAIEKGKSKLSEAVLCLMEVNYRLNRVWLETGEGEPFVKAWFNKLNLFQEQGGPILDNFRMELEVVSGKKDQSNSSITSIIKTDPWREVLDMARHVLASGTDYAGSLASTIKLSYNAIQAQKLLEEKCDKALNELEQIKQQLSTGRGKVEDADAAQAAAS